MYPDGTHFQVPGNPMQMSGMERQMDFETARLGEDTIRILSEVADEAKVHAIMDPVLKQAKEKSDEMYAKS